MTDTPFIPIENLYHLLCYAWADLPTADEVEVTARDCHHLDELLARVLTNGVATLLQRGLDRDYLVFREETARPTGKFDIPRSVARQTLRRGRVVCEYDELSHDVLHNRIIATTLRKLTNVHSLKPETQALLRQQHEQLRHLTPLRIEISTFRRVRLHRNNRHYRLVLNVCELIHHSLLPTQQKGRTRFRDILRDEDLMPGLFERFVRNFYARHSRHKVGAHHLHWQITADEASARLVPRLETDVCLVSADRQIILDCKFYKSAFSVRDYAGQQSTKFKRDHLFQLFAYLENAASSKGWQNVEGILLYPAVTDRFHHQLTLNSHPLTLTSIDLGQPWQAVETHLLEIVEK